MIDVPSELALPLTRERDRMTPFASDVRWLARTASTMDLVQAAAETAPEGLLVVADEQTAGRGRRGRVWASPAGAGLYFSALLRPPRQPSAMALLTLAMGVGVAEGVAAATGLRTELKWPNDVLVGRRKLAGILAEGVAVGTPAQAVVLGVGLNILSSAYPPDVAKRATSLEDELGRPVDRGEVLAQVLVALARWYRVLCEARYDEVLDAWRAAAPSAVGATIEWATPRGVRRGVTAGVDESGALLVRTSEGVERLIAGEVTWA